METTVDDLMKEKRDTNIAADLLRQKLNDLIARYQLSGAAARLQSARCRCSSRRRLPTDAHRLPHQFGHERCGWRDGEDEEQGIELKLPTRGSHVTPFILMTN